MPESLEQLWRGIEGSGSGGKAGWVRRRANPGARIAAHVALRAETGAMSLMIDIPVAAVGGLRELPSTAGLSVTVQAISGISAGERALVVELEDREFADIFAVFCTDIIDRLASCRRVADAITLVLERLARWQHFLSVAATGLERSALVGLFGELVFLRDVLMPVGGVGLLGAWTGAQRLPQDFIVPGVCAVEVKTSEDRILDHAHINGEGQLDGSGLTVLFLGCYRLEVDPERGESLSDVVSALRSLAAVAPEFGALFEKRLAAANYFDRHSRRYGQIRFRVAEQRFFRVLDGFPRVIRSGLPSGVDRVEYRLDLRPCVPFECTRQEVEQSLRQLDLPGGNPA